VGVLADGRVLVDERWDEARAVERLGHLLPHLLGDDEAVARALETRLANSIASKEGVTPLVSIALALLVLHRRPW
jgi:hypothetical protein